MSFLFKSSKKGASGPVATPNAPSLHSVREQASKDPGAPSQIPTFNGAKPGSPTPPQSVNTSLNSIQGFDRPALARPADERTLAIREEGAEQKMLREVRRDTSQDAVCAKHPRARAL